MSKLTRDILSSRAFFDTFPNAHYKFIHSEDSIKGREKQQKTKTKPKPKPKPERKNKQTMRCSNVCKDGKMNFEHKLDNYADQSPWREMSRKDFA